MTNPQLSIKKIATAQGLDQRRLSEKAGVNATLLNRYWNNRVGSPELSKLAKIARALGVQTGDLIVDDEAG